jgi:hypothetical protein
MKENGDVIKISAIKVINYLVAIFFVIGALYAVTGLFIPHIEGEVCSFMGLTIMLFVLMFGLILATREDLIKEIREVRHLDENLP